MCYHFSTPCDYYEVITITFKHCQIGCSVSRENNEKHQYVHRLKQAKLFFFSLKNKEKWFFDTQIGFFHIKMLSYKRVCPTDTHRPVLNKHLAHKITIIKEIKVWISLPKWTFSHNTTLGTGMPVKNGTLTK